MSSRTVVDRRPGGSSPVVGVVNPLPVALAHYVSALTHTLAATGVEVIQVPTPSAEVGGAGGVRRLAVAGRLATSRVRGRTVEADVIVSVWPAFGLLDPALWPRGTRVWHVVHDPSPLRRQFGYGRLAAVAGSAGLGPKADVLVHSSVAAAELARRGWPAATLLPHPIVPTAVAPRPDDRSQDVLVLGQYKPARDLAALDLIARQLAGRMPLSIRGRGWPGVAGWSVHPEFLDERDFDRRLAQASCLVLPYSRYFASGVAVRALEQRTPVVAPRHPMLADLLGPGWPGFVEGDAWSEAIDRVLRLGPDDMDAVYERYAAHAARAWAEQMTTVVPTEFVSGRA